MGRPSTIKIRKAPHASEQAVPKNVVTARRVSACRALLASAAQDRQLADRDEYQTALTALETLDTAWGRAGL